jgi:hypothetical protein
MIAGATRGRAAVGIERTVTTSSGRVASQLARDRRKRRTRPVRDLPDAQVAQTDNLDPLVLRQKPRADPTYCQPLQRRYEPDDLTAAVRRVTTDQFPVVLETPTSRAAARMLHPR